MTFDYIYSSILPFCGKIFGLFGWFGNLTFGDFIDFFTIFGPEHGLKHIEFINLFTGEVETSVLGNFGDTVFDILFAPTYLSGRIGLLWLDIFGVSMDTPMWVVCAFYFVLMSVLVGLAVGFVKAVIR